MSYCAGVMRVGRVALALMMWACGDVQPTPSAALSQAEAEAEGSWTLAQAIPAFSHPVLASYDEHIVLLAESIYSGDQNIPGAPRLDMWAWDGDAWTMRYGASARSAPSARLLPGLTHLRDKLVMFGGFTEPADPRVQSGQLSETWEWNGLDWTRIYPHTAPQGRSQLTLTPWRDQVLMFGGQTDGAALRDTWTWNGADWLPHATQHAPPYCNSPTAALGDRVIMFCSARAADDPSGHTWEWDGTDWHEKASQTRPGNRYLHTLASFGDRVVMYGGYADSGALQETWVWDGNDWTDVSVQPSPPPREGYQLAQLGPDLVLYGGGTGETWAWNGSTWRLVAPPAMPAARSDYALAAVGGKVILFGGCCKSKADATPKYWSDTWQWDGTRWTQLAPKRSPPARAASALAAVDAHTALLFGGVGDDGLLADTWQWDAVDNTWIERASATAPTARQRHALAARDGKVILFGGTSALQPSASDALGDTWEWTGERWTRLLAIGAPEPLPPPSYDAALAAFDSTLILVTSAWDRNAWIWDGGAWAPMSASVWEEPVTGPVYLTVMSSSSNRDAPRLVASVASTFSWLLMRQWDGTSWSYLPKPPQLDEDAPARPLASLGNTLVTLNGSPQRTHVYTRR